MTEKPPENESGNILGNDGPEQEINEQIKKKDFFISYNKNDQQWAEWVAFTLEDAGYSVIIQSWDFLPGKNFVLEIDKATVNSNRTIVVLSQDYVDALHTQTEWVPAFARDIAGNESTLIPIKIEEIKLEGVLSQYVCLELLKKEEEWAKEDLLSTIEAITSGDKRIKPKGSIPYPDTIEKPDYPLKAPFNIDKFIHLRLDEKENRIELIKILKTYLKEEVHESPYAIAGMHGVGKSFLAGWMSREFKDDFPDGIIWSKFGEEKTVDSVLDDLADQLGLNFSDQSITRKGSQMENILSEKKLLLVLDDVKTWEQIDPFIFPDHRTRSPILVTTYDNELARRISNELTIKVEPFSKETEHSVELFKKLLKLECLTDETINLLPELSYMLGHLPLAIRVIAERANHYELCSIEKTVKQFRKNGINLSRNPFKDMKSLFDSSFDQLDEDTQVFFAKLSIFGSNEFRVDCLEYITGNNEDEVIDAIHVLSDLSLIEITGERCRLHSLIYEYIKDKAYDARSKKGILKRREIKNLLKKKADYFIDFAERNKDDRELLESEIGSIYEALDFVFVRKDYKKLIKGLKVFFRGSRPIGSIYSKAKEFVNDIDEGTFESLDKENQVEMLLLKGIVNNMLREGMSEDEEAKIIEPFERALNLLKEMPTNDEYSLTKAQVLANLGATNIYVDDESAVRYLSEAIELYKSIDDDNVFANSGQIKNKLLAHAYCNLGKAKAGIDPREGKDIIDMALNLAKKINDTMRITDASQALGDALNDLGELEEARKVLEKGLIMSERMYDPWYVIFHNIALAENHRRSKDYDKAIEYVNKSKEEAVDYDLQVPLSRAKWVSFDIKVDQITESDEQYPEEDIQEAKSILNDLGESGEPVITDKLKFFSALAKKFFDRSDLFYKKSYEEIFLPTFEMLIEQNNLSIAEYLLELMKSL